MEALDQLKLNLSAIRKQFPILDQKVHGKPLIYFDNGATTQKPLAVINSMVEYYSSYNSNIHRGVHTLSQIATTRYDKARETVASFIHAKNSAEIIFTRGTTESINFIAYVYGDKFIQERDEVLITAMEHHSNILPWQELCNRKKAILKVVPIDEKGQLIIGEVEKLLSSKTKLFAFAHVSNTLGTVNDVKSLVALAHAKNIPVLVDGAQAVPHLSVNVQELDVDFYCFSGHKMYAPTGIGVLYAKEKWLQQFDTYQSGGGTIKTVEFAKTEYTEAPHKFEAGTPNIEGAIGLAAAIDFMQEIGLGNLARYEHELMEYATSRLSTIPGLKIIGTAPCKAGVISFVVENVHALDIGMLLDAQGIAVRTGHHCTQPLMKCFNVEGTVRISFAAYNTKDEIDSFIKALEKALQRLK